MTCPNCGSDKYERYKAPRLINAPHLVNPSELLVRRHRCLSCRSLFLTGQMVLTGKLARDLAMILEAPAPTTGSVLMLRDEE